MAWVEVYVGQSSLAFELTTKKSQQGPWHKVDLVLLLVPQAALITLCLLSGTGNVQFCIAVRAVGALDGTVWFW